MTRARDAVLFTVDTSVGFVHPFLRELVEPPDPGEHETLRAWLAQEADGALRERIADRAAEIEVLYPESVPETGTAGTAGGATVRTAAARRAHSGRRRPAAAVTLAAQRSQNRIGGSGGATKCFAVGSVPSRRNRCSSCWSSKSVTVRRWC